jgi:hypothetical protein
MIGFLDFPDAHFDAGAAFWRAVTGSSLSARRGDHHEFATLLPPTGDSYLRVQNVGSSNPGCHLDLHVDDMRAEADRAVGLGAAIRTVQDDVVVLESPGALAFCLVDDHSDPGGPQRPPPPTWPGGHRSLVDQLCVDIPSPAFETECAFWAALTGWERRPGARPEFEYLVRPAAMPLRILLQRLTEYEPESACRAHVDLACDDVKAEVRRHEDLDATVVHRMPGWVTLRDPSGLEYCITRRDPDTGRLGSPA